MLLGNGAPIAYLNYRRRVLKHYVEGPIIDSHSEEVRAEVGEQLQAKYQTALRNLLAETGLMEGG